jgi:hypothetical protein
MAEETVRKEKLINYIKFYVYSVIIIIKVQELKTLTQKVQFSSIFQFIFSDFVLNNNV